MSASSFNDYPYGGLFSFDNLTFEKQRILIDETGERFYGRLQECDKPDYFKKLNKSLLFS